MSKIKTDENISKSTIAFLNELGFDVKGVGEEDLRGCKDERVINFAEEEKRVVITLYKDFGDYLKFPMTARFGVVLLRLKHAYPAYVNVRLKELFDEVDLNVLPNSLVVVSERKIRVRKPISG